MRPEHLCQTQKLHITFLFNRPSGCLHSLLNTLQHIGIAYSGTGTVEDGHTWVITIGIPCHWHTSIVDNSFCDGSSVVYHHGIADEMHQNVAFCTF